VLVKDRYAVPSHRGDSKVFLVGDFFDGSPVRDGDRIRVVGYLVKGVDGLSVSSRNALAKQNVNDAGFSCDHEFSILAKSEDMVFDDRAEELIRINNGDFQNEVLILDVTYNRDGYQQHGLLSSEEYLTIHIVSAP